MPGIANSSNANSLLEWLDNHNYEVDNSNKESLDRNSDTPLAVQGESFPDEHLRSALLQYSKKIKERVHVPVFSFTSMSTHHRSFKSSRLIPYWKHLVKVLRQHDGQGEIWRFDYRNISLIPLTVVGPALFPRNIRSLELTGLREEWEVDGEDVLRFACECLENNTFITHLALKHIYTEPIGRDEGTLVPRLCTAIERHASLEELQLVDVDLEYEVRHSHDYVDMTHLPLVLDACRNLKYLDLCDTWGREIQDLQMSPIDHYADEASRMIAEFLEKKPNNLQQLILFDFDPEHLCRCPRFAENIANALAANTYLSVLDMGAKNTNQITLQAWDAFQRALLSDNIQTKLADASKTKLDSVPDHLCLEQCLGLAMQHMTETRTKMSDDTVFHWGVVKLTMFYEVLRRYAPLLEGGLLTLKNTRLRRDI